MTYKTTSTITGHFFKKKLIAKINLFSINTKVPCKNTYFNIFRYFQVYWALSLMTASIRFFFKAVSSALSSLIQMILLQFLSLRRKGLVFPTLPSLSISPVFTSVSAPNYCSIFCQAVGHSECCQVRHPLSACLIVWRELPFPCYWQFSVFINVTRGQEDLPQWPLFPMSVPKMLANLLPPASRNFSWILSFLPYFISLSLLISWQETSSGAWINYTKNTI